MHVEQDRHEAQASTLRVGFVGLGEMGLPMANRLRHAGWPLLVTDASSVKREAALADGFTVESDAASVARHSDLVVVMVPARHVEEVMGGSRGILAALPAGSTVVEGGNSDPAKSVVWAGRFFEKGAHFLDAGFSGGPLGAAEGTLAVMVGGDHEAFQTALPVFADLGREIGYFGTSGNGHLAKAINHLVQGLTAQAIGEALAIAEAAGIDPLAWVRVAADGAAGSWLMDRTREMLEHQPPDAKSLTRWWRTFGVRNQLVYSHEAATAMGIPVPLTATGQQVRAIASGAGRTAAMDNYLRLTWQLAHGTTTDREPADCSKGAPRGNDRG